MKKFNEKTVEQQIKIYFKEVVDLKYFLFFILIRSKRNFENDSTSMRA